MYEDKRQCIDCGQEFIARSVNSKRCRKCQRKYRIKMDTMRRRQKEGVTKKDVKGAVYINGHPQVCTHLASCFYGSQNENGCSYLLETGRSRIGQGLYIENGKCPAYRRKGGKIKRKDIQTYSRETKSIKESIHNYSET